MEVLKTIFFKMGHLLLNAVGIFRRALCCFRKRRRASDCLLPISVSSSDILTAAAPGVNFGKPPDLQSWDSWNEGDAQKSSIVNRLNAGGPDRHSLSSEDDNYSENDFFKEMAPSINRPKIYAVKNTSIENATSHKSSRLNMDLKDSFNHLSPELGTIDDNIETWEDSAASEEVWDSESVIREQRRLERERRMAEHQRRKFEKEVQRTGKHETSVMALRLS